MKKLLFTLFIFIAITSYGQSNFEKGFDDGWCQAHKEDKGDFIMCNRIAIPMAPMPQMFKDGYKDGFSLGYKTYSNKNSSGNSSGNQALIDGSKKMYEQSASKGLDLGLSYTPPKSSNNRQASPLAQYNEEKTTIKYQLNQITKAMKKIRKYGYLVDDDCDVYKNPDCKWVQYSNSKWKDKYKFEEWVSNRTAFVIGYNNLRKQYGYD